MEFWLILVGLRVAVAFVWIPWLIKIAATGKGRAERFALQFASAFLVALILGLWSGMLSLDRWMFVAGLLGFFSAFGAYCQWRAMDLSLSRYGLFAWVDDVIAIGLGYVVLVESKFLNSTMAAGIILAFASVIAFLIRDMRRKKEASEGSIPLSFYGWTLGYCTVFGVAIFLIRVLALREVTNVGTFLVGWYAGAFCVAVAILLGKRAVLQAVGSLTKRDIAGGLVLGASIIVALGLHFYILRIAPIISTQSIFFIAEAILPTLIGLWVFKEKRGLKPPDYLLFALALMGVVLIASGFR